MQLSGTPSCCQDFSPIETTTHKLRGPRMDYGMSSILLLIAAAPSFGGPYTLSVCTFCVCLTTHSPFAGPLLLLLLDSSAAVWMTTQGRGRVSNYARLCDAKCPTVGTELCRLDTITLKQKFFSPKFQRRKFSTHRSSALSRIFQLSSRRAPPPPPPLAAGTLPAYLAA